jgi:hypothetical protein
MKVQVHLAVAGIGIFVRGDNREYATTLGVDKIPLHLETARTH